MGLTALLLVLPVLLYNYLYLGPTNAELWQAAQDQLVNFRIPHHSIPDIWIDQTTTIKVGIVVVALLLVVRSQLFPIMGIAFATALGLTWLQMQVNWDTLAFIAPWRISVFLVPLATAMIGAFVITRLTNSVSSRLPENGSRILMGVIIVVAVAWAGLLVGRGAMAMQDSFQARRTSDMTALWDFGWNTKAPGQTYLVPTHMADFRLETGLPVVITFKSHPYKDVEVLDWRERIDSVNNFYANISCDGIQEMSTRYAVTHVVLERVQFFDGCPIIHNIHLDDRYGVFQVVNE